MTGVSDRGPQFVSKIWDHVCQRFGIERKLSTAYHLQTHWQIETINGLIEQHFRGYVNYLRNNWMKWLLLDKLSGNIADSQTTGMSPFFTNYRYHPEIQTDLSPAKEPENSQARTVVMNLEEV